MQPLFYYGRDLLCFGPYSPTQMRAFAAAGTILPTDSVWQSGDGRKLAAAKVKNLFAGPLPVDECPAAPAAGPPALAAPALGTLAVDTPLSHAPVLRARADSVSALETQRTPERPEKAPPQPPKPKRVIRIRGGVLLGQDGTTVRFFKKCEVCGGQEPTRSSAAIRSGAMRITFFCRPCRKARTIELFGV